MKLLALLVTFSMANDENPHDPEAMAYCEGKKEGYYANPKDCGSYFFCWNNGIYISCQAQLLNLCFRPYW